MSYYYDRDYVPTPPPIIYPDELIFYGNTDIKSNKYDSRNNDIGTIDISCLVPFYDSEKTLQENRVVIMNLLLDYLKKGKLILSMPSSNNNSYIYLDGLTLKCTSIYGPVTSDTSQIIFGSNRVYRPGSVERKFNIFIVMDLFNFVNKIKDNKADKYPYWFITGNSIGSVPSPT